MGALDAGSNQARTKTPKQPGLGTPLPHRVSTMTSPTTPRALLYLSEAIENENLSSVDSVPIYMPVDDFMCVCMCTVSASNALKKQKDKTPWNSIPKPPSNMLSFRRHFARYANMLL